MGTHLGNRRAGLECEGKREFHCPSGPLLLCLIPSFPIPHKGVRSPTEPTCRVVFENEQDNNSVTKTQRKRSLVTAEPQHVTLIVFGIGMVNRTHLEADIGGLTMESELKRIHGSFTLKEKMKGTAAASCLPPACRPCVTKSASPLCGSGVQY